MRTYSIADWDTRYENNRTRDMKSMAWIPVPNSHDGDGYTVLVGRENGAAYLGAWLAILQVASRCAPRGTLLRDGGKPHDSASIARMTRLSEDIIKATLKVCLEECNWLTFNESHDGAAIPQEGAVIPHPTDEEQNRTEQKEEKRKEQKSATSFHPDSKAMLSILNAATGKRFRETEVNLSLISARLKEPGVDADGVRQMIARQVGLWLPDAKMAEYLRPETLFGKSKFDSYYAARLTPVRAANGCPSGPEFCEGWRRKPESQMTDREKVAFAQS